MYCCKFSMLFLGDSFENYWNVIFVLVSESFCHCFGCCRDNTCDYLDRVPIDSLDNPDNFIGIALLLSGISKIMHDVNDKYDKKWKKGFGIGVGALSIALAAMVLTFLLSVLVLPGR
jgi:hypothetical protein